MGQDKSIGIGSGDSYVQALTTMHNANQSFNKDLTGFQSKLDALNKTKAILKVDTDKARTDLAKAEKQFARTGKEADKLKLVLANAKYENAQRNLSLVADNAREAEKEMVNLSNMVSKTENRASNAKTARSEILNSLATSGAASFVENVISDISNVIGSGLGSEVGTRFSSTLSGAINGAAIGTAVIPIPGIGTAIGTIAGSILGWIHGEAKIFEEKDAAFKNYYQDQYNSVQQTQADALTRGTAIASTREQDRILFSTVLGGDDNADAYLKEIMQFSADTPFAYEELKNISKSMLASGYSKDEIIPQLSNIGDAGVAQGWSLERINQVITYLGSMNTAGKATLENLNPIMEGIGEDVFQILADADTSPSGITREDVINKVSEGSISGAEAAKAISDYLGTKYAGNMDKQAETFAGLVKTLADTQDEIDGAMGIGYTDTRGQGVQKQKDWLSGESGEKMKGAYEKIGMWKASQENLSEQYQRDALESVMTGTISESFTESKQKGSLERLAVEYKNALIEYGHAERAGNDEAMQSAGAKMGRILAEAEAIAQNEYNASDGAQLLLDTNKTLADNLRKNADLHDLYYSAGYEMGLKFSKGMVDALPVDTDSFEKMNSAAITLDLSMFENGTEKMPEESNKEPFILKVGQGKAFGLSYVPYNNYPALLHEGERVLTASENRSFGKGAEIKITGNSFVVREEADIAKVASELFKQMNQAYMLAQ